MATKSQQPKGREDTLSSLNTAIDAINLAKDVSTIPPAKAAFDSASVFLATIRVRFLQVQVGQLPADVCRTR